MGDWNYQGSQGYVPHKTNWKRLGADIAIIGGILAVKHHRKNQRGTAQVTTIGAGMAAKGKAKKHNPQYVSDFVMKRRKETGDNRGQSF